MQVWRKTEEIPADLGRSVVTIGIFDGVHKGHKAVLARTVDEARQRGLVSIALTFDPHPATVHNPGRPIHLVTTLNDRLDRLAAAGIDATFVQHYTLDYAQASPREFVEKQIVGDFHAALVVVGEDVRFGKNNSGDGNVLRELGDEYGFDVILLDDLRDKKGRRWSSTRVRELLADGDVAGAAKVLGRPHQIRGHVVHGFQRGRELGFPTANLAGDNLGEVPGDGVYAGWLVRSVPGSQAAEYLPAAISVGTNPQFDGEERTVEAHVLGRADLNLYDEPIAINFIERLRPMESFTSVEELLAQMDEDLRRTAEVLGVPTAGRVDPAAVTAR
ncbi:bifunctional riboflavin kinase/FAD synthetase [Arcanobacterium haemolyticum]|nr:bifunctional riboflavin kinase/FAD synthetase [Arcanobacterium haemolyticum]